MKILVTLRTQATKPTTNADMYIAIMSCELRELPVRKAAPSVARSLDPGTRDWMTSQKLKENETAGSVQLLIVPLRPWQ